MLNYNRIQQKYQDNGLLDNRLRNLKDLQKVHNVNIENIEGINSVDREVFEPFLVKFYNAQGLEARESLHPISVKNEETERDGSYIRFTYLQDDKITEIGSRKPMRFSDGSVKWLHVKSPDRWY